MLAVADRQSVSGHGGEIVASPGSSVGGLSARGARPGASGYVSPISLFTFCGPSGRFPNGLSSTGPGRLAGVASGCSFLPGIMCGLSGQEVSTKVCWTCLLQPRKEIRYVLV